MTTITNFIPPLLTNPSMNFEHVPRLQTSGCRLRLHHSRRRWEAMPVRDSVEYPPKLLGLSLMTKYLQSGALGVINFVMRIGTLAELSLIFIYFSKLFETFLRQPR